MTTTSQIARLRSLVAAGYASEEEQAELAAFDALAQGGSQAPRATRTARVRSITPPVTRLAPEAPATGDDDDLMFVNLNTESFEQGGNNFSPPPREGIYPGRCTGAMVPTQAEDQLWFLFEGTEEPFSGALVTSALTRPGTGPGGSGAFKVQSVLNALEVPYQVHPDIGVEFRKSHLQNALCQVEWAYIENKGTRQLRIQNVFPVGKAIESL